MDNEQKYRLKVYIGSASNGNKCYTNHIGTIKEFEELGYLEPVTPRKVYRWKHSNIEIKFIDLDSTQDNYYVYAGYTLDFQSFYKCLAAGLIIETEEIEVKERQTI